MTNGRSPFVWAAWLIPILFLMPVAGAKPDHDALAHDVEKGSRGHEGKTHAEKAPREKAHKEGRTDEKAPASRPEVPPAAHPVPPSPDARPEAPFPVSSDSPLAPPPPQPNPVPAPPPLEFQHRPETPAAPIIPMDSPPADSGGGPAPTAPEATPAPPPFSSPPTGSGPALPATARLPAAAAPEPLAAVLDRAAVPPAQDASSSQDAAPAMVELANAPGPGLPESSAAPAPVVPVADGRLISIEKASHAKSVGGVVAAPGFSLLGWGLGGVASAAGGLYGMRQFRAHGRRRLFAAASDPSTFSERVRAWRQHPPGPAEAIPGLVGRVRRTPFDANARFDLGVRFVEMGQMERAIAELQLAFRLQPTHLLRLLSEPAYASVRDRPEVRLALRRYQREMQRRIWQGYA